MIGRAVITMCATGLVAAGAVEASASEGNGVGQGGTPPGHANLAEHLSDIALHPVFANHPGRGHAIGRDGNDDEFGISWASGHGLFGERGVWKSIGSAEVEFSYRDSTDYATAVPLPGAVALGASGLAGVGLRRRRAI